MEKSLFEQMDRTYRQVGDNQIPNFTLPPEVANITLAKWGILHKDYLLKHNKMIFTTLLVQNKLWQYLANIEIQAQQMYNTIIEQIKEAEDVTEQLKAENQMEWVDRMNNIQNRANEIVCAELIYL